MHRSKTAETSSSTLNSHPKKQHDDMSLFGSFSRKSATTTSSRRNRRFEDYYDYYYYDAEEGEEDLDQIDQALKYGSLVGVGMWIFLSTLIYFYHEHHLDTTTTTATTTLTTTSIAGTTARTVFLLLLVTTASRIFPIAFQTGGFGFCARHGVVWINLCMQFIAIASNAMEAFMWTTTTTAVEAAASAWVLSETSGHQDDTNHAYSSSSNSRFGFLPLMHWAKWTSLAFLQVLVISDLETPLLRLRTRAASSSTAATPSTTTPLSPAFCMLLSCSCFVVFPFLLEKVETSPFTAAVLKLLQLILSCSTPVVLGTRFLRKVTRFLMETKTTEGQGQQQGNNSPCWWAPRKFRHPVYGSLQWAVIHLQLACLCTFLRLIMLLLLWRSGSEMATPWWSLSPLLLTESTPQQPGVRMAVLYGALEVVSMVWFQAVLLHLLEHLFMDDAQSKRHHRKLRNFMTAIWEKASDVIVLCQQDPHTGVFRVRVNPTFLKLTGFASTATAQGHDCKKEPSRQQQPEEHDPEQPASLSFEISADRHYYTVRTVEVSQQTSSDCQHVDFLDVSVRSDPSRRVLLAPDNADTSRLSVRERGEQTLVHLALTAFDRSNSLKKKENDDLVTLELATRDQKGNERTTHCEAKLTRPESHSCILFVRNVSENLEAFEQEKVSIELCTIRDKDCATNHFQRHEIKNRILSAMGILEHIRYGDHLYMNAADSSPASPRQQLRTTSTSSTARERSSLLMEDVDLSIQELDMTLRSTLDTVLEEAMAREISHGSYQPHLSPTNVQNVVEAIQTRSATSRFKISVMPDPFPTLLVDEHILRFVFRNAISNACKHGNKDDIVHTTLRFDHNQNTFTMQIINSTRGAVDDNSTLTVVGHTSSEASSDGGDIAGDVPQKMPVAASSSGSGLWMMQKCAELVQGTSELRLQANKSAIYTFKCHASAASASDFPETKIPPPNQEVGTGSSSDDSEKKFQLPPSTWGIVLEDAAVQRKLLGRFLANAGISESKIVIMGQHSQEIFDFTSRIAQLVNDHPDDKFLVIVDENLDIVEGGALEQTVSGSLCVEKLRQSLGEFGEERMLALVRSANDSTEDLAMYQSRAHGYLLKQPLNGGRGGVKNAFLDLIEPWWKGHFHY